MAGLSANAERLLGHVARTIGARLSRLAAETGLDQSCIEAAVIELSDKGLVTVSEMPNRNAEMGVDRDHIEITTLGYMQAAD